MQKTKTYRITRIDPRVWRKFKAACSYYGIDMREIFVTYIQQIGADYEWASNNKVLVSINDLFRLGHTLEEKHLCLGEEDKKGGKKS